MVPSPDQPSRSHVVVYAGSFDPITLGHLDVIGRARRLFDRIVVGIGHNPEKLSLFSFAERMEMARALVEEMVTTEARGAPVEVEHYTGLTVDFARSVGASALLRGIRNISDLAAECQLAITNRKVADVESVFIVTGDAYAFTSSSLIRQIAAMGGSVDGLESMVPPLVLRRLEALRRSPDNPLSRLVRDGSLE